jgi:hypothetical protein
MCHTTEVVSFFLDACLTLQALVECLPQAAALLLHPQQRGELLWLLAAVHGSTLPLIARVAQQPAAAGVPGLAPGRTRQLQHSLESLVFQLLRAAFCTRAGAGAAGGPQAIAAAAVGKASSSSSSSSKQSGGGPAAAAAAAAVAAGPFDPEVQGQELMNLLMLLADPADALPQHQGQGQGQQGHAGLLGAVNHTHHLDVAVAAAVAEVCAACAVAAAGAAAAAAAACRTHACCCRAASCGPCDTVATPLTR